MFGISIHWTDLFQVAVASAGVGIGIVVVFTIGVLGLDRLGDAHTGVRPTRRGSGLVVAGVAFTVCAVTILFGLYLLIPQFHN